MPLKLGSASPVVPPGISAALGRGDGLGRMQPGLTATLRNRGTPIPHPESDRRTDLPRSRDHGGSGPASTVHSPVRPRRTSPGQMKAFPHLRAGILSVLLFVGLLLPASAWTPGTGSPNAVQGFIVDSSDRTDILAFYNTIYPASEG